MALIKKIDYKGNEFNDLHKYEIELEDNGEKVIGNIFKKTDNPYFKEGDEVEYTLNDKGTFKLNKPGQTPYNKQNTTTKGSYNYKTNEDDEAKRIARSVALKLAVQYGPSFGVTFMKDIGAIADSFTTYIIEGTLPFPSGSDRKALTPADVKQGENDPF